MRDRQIQTETGRYRENDRERVRVRETHSDPFHPRSGQLLPPSRI